jgi:hypothetical protein
MTNLHIENHYKAFEDVMKRMVTIAATQHFREALYFLYINGSVMSFNQKLSLPIFIDLIGDEQNVKEAVDLLQAEANTTLASFMSRLYEHLLNVFLSLVQDNEFLNIISNIKEGNLKMENVIPVYIANKYNKIDIFELKNPETLIETSFALMQLIIINMFNAFYKLRKELNHNFLNENKYNKMVELLRRLNIITPKLQISICSKCTNHQFTLSSYASYSDRCTKCGYKWITTTLYVFEERLLSELKSNNNDLPVFISAYLRNKLYLHSLKAKDIEIYPCAKVNINGKDFEIDVYIKGFNTAIECKVFLDPLAKMTESRLGSISGELVSQIKNFLLAEVKKVIVVTNLPSDYTKMLEESLQNKIKQENIDVMIKVIDGDIDSLIKMLDEIVGSMSQEISNKITGNIKMLLENRLSKNQLSQDP